MQPSAGLTPSATLSKHSLVPGRNGRTVGSKRASEQASREGGREKGKAVGVEKNFAIIMKICVIWKGTNLRTKA